MVNHYVYKIEFTLTGHFYFGVRSCKCNPSEDTKYLGSPVTYKIFWENNIPCKTVIRNFASRLEANEFEKVLINWSWSVNKALSLNAGISGAKFNSQGCKRDQNFKQKVRERRQKSFKLVSPKGRVISGINLRNFARKNNLLESKLYSVITGLIFQYKGWTASLEANKIYQEMVLKRGISRCNKYWKVKWVKDKNSTQKYFNSFEEAIEFRDSLEKQGYKFKVCCKGWREKLSNER